MPMAISYIRFSTVKQDKGSSAERQRQAVNRWLEKHPHYTLYDKPYDDLGRSGYHGDHVDNAFGRLLAAIEDGTIPKGSTILIEQIDRAGRMEPMEMLPLLSRIVNAGVDLVTLDDGITYDRQSANNNHLFLLVAKVQAAWSYSKTLSERTKASYESRRAKAKNGEQVKRHTPVWLDAESKLKPDIVPHIQQAFDLYISGVGKYAIANRLRATGEPAFATTVGSTVGKWLNNKAATGYWEGKNGHKDIPGVYPPVVTPEVFQQAQNRQEQAKTTPKTYTTKNFLVGLIKCGVCGGNYSIHRKEGKPHNMRCRIHHLQGDARCTNNETIPYQVVHHIYLQTATEWIDKAMKVIRLTENDKRKLTLTSERETLSAAIDRLVRLTLMGQSDELEAQYKLAIERRTAIDSELSVLERTGDDGIESKSKSIILGYEAVLEHDSLAFHDPIKLSALLKQAGYSITLQPGKKLYLPDDNEPWVYDGAARKGNTTLGYRIHAGKLKYTISKDIPEITDVRVYENLPSGGQAKHIYDRSYKVLSHNLRELD